MSFLKNARIPVLALGLLFAATAVATPPPQEEGAQEPAAEENVLHERMEEVRDAMKKLRRSVRSAAKRDAALRDLGTLQAAALACKGEVPAMAARVPEAEREAFVAGYRKMMIEFLRLSLELEAALLDGDTEKATEVYGKLGAMEDEGHDAYIHE